MDASREQELIARFSLATFLEAVRLYDEGIATAEDIDIAMRAGAGLRQGPFYWADSRGLDVVHQELTQMQATVGERFKPPDSLTQRVTRGELGKKTGRGYLVHDRLRDSG